MFTVHRNSDKELPGSSLPGETLNDGIERLETKMVIRHSVWEAALGQLNPADIAFVEGGLSIRATAELRTLAEMTFGQDGTVEVDITKFAILPLIAFQ